MTTTTTLRRVPWTCRWGRFAEVPPPPRWLARSPRFIFWTCDHPARETDRLRRDSCERCGRWVPTDSKSMMETA
jgi:hypothetical protein